MLTLVTKLLLQGPPPKQFSLLFPQHFISMMNAHVSLYSVWHLHIMSPKLFPLTFRTEQFSSSLVTWDISLLQHCLLLQKTVHYIHREILTNYAES